MKTKTNLLLLIILIFAFSVNAQSTFKLGIIGGLNRSNLSGVPPNNTKYNSRIIPAIGLNSELGISEYVQISFRPMYIGKGTNISFDVPGQRDDVDSLKITMDYFTFPVFFKVFADNRKFYIIGGFDFGILIDAEIKSLIGQPISQNIKKGLRSYDLTINFGIGYQFKIGKPVFTLEAQYAQGLLNISQSYKGEYGIELPREFKSRGLQLWIGLLYPLGKQDKLSK